MKYSEFEAIAGKFGWGIDNSYSRWLYADKPGVRIVIDKTETEVLKIIADGVYFYIFEEKEFIKACYELAETPLEERGEPKEYYVQLPLTNNNHRTLYLEIGAYGEPFWSHATRGHFTEQQIKEIDERLWPFAVEVEDEQSE